MPKNEPTAEAKRLAEIAWQCYEGDYSSLRKIIESQGGSWEECGDGTQICHSKYGVPTVGFVGRGGAGDPVTTYVQVCFALIGELWPHVPAAAEGQQLLNKQWKERTKAAKTTKTEEVVSIPTKSPPIAPIFPVRPTS